MNNLTKVIFYTRMFVMLNRLDRALHMLRKYYH